MGWTGNRAGATTRGGTAQFGEMVLRLYNPPVARALPALADLVFCPYGCTEQTASTLLGIALLARLLNAAERPCAGAVAEKGTGVTGVG